MEENEVAKPGEAPVPFDVLLDTDFDKNNEPLTMSDIDKQLEQDRKEQEETPGKNGIVLVNERGTAVNQYHSQTRTDCVFQVVERQVEIQKQANLSQLKTNVSSLLITDRKEIEVRLKVLLQSQFNLALGTQISVATGIPLVPAVTAKGAASVSQQQSAQLAGRFAQTIQMDLLLYIVRVHGNILARKVAQVREVWQWVGRDCEEMGVPGTGWENRYTLEGHWVEIPINWVFVIPQILSPRDRPGGPDWATQEAKPRLHDRIRNMHRQFLRVPEPPAVPPPITPPQ